MKLITPSKPVKVRTVCMCLDLLDELSDFGHSRIDVYISYTCLLLIMSTLSYSVNGHGKQSLVTGRNEKIRKSSHKDNFYK